MQQSKAGSARVTIAKGFSADAKVQCGRTYELTAGMYGSVGVSTSSTKDLLRSSGGGYAQIKYIDTVRVYEQNWAGPVILRGSVSSGCAP